MTVDIAVDLVRKMICIIVDQRDQVRVTTSHEGEATVLMISVAESDWGFVIGKQGRMITAIRTILKAVGERSSRRYQVQLQTITDGTAVETFGHTPTDSLQSELTDL